MKTILIIIFIVIYSTVSAQTLDSEDNGWMFSDYTYKKLGDYSLCFIQGAGVSRHHHFIFERFPTKKDLEDSLFIWQINGDNLRNGDNASMGHVFSREHYQNPYYDRSVLPALYSGKKFTNVKILFFCPDLLRLKYLQVIQFYIIQKTCLLVKMK